LTQLPTTPGWSPSVRKALLWASGCAALGGDHRPITSDDLFVGLLLAHPDPKGEVWQFLDHFGLTARDVLPDDRRVLDDDALRTAAAAARGPDVSDWSPDVSRILDEAESRATGQTQVLHVLASLLSQAPWPERLQSGLARFGISATDLVRELSDVVPSLDSVDLQRANADSIELTSDTTAGDQIGQWLARRYPRRPATMASFSNDAPDPGADFIGVSPEADAFAYLIASRTLVPPLAIGLFGTWGSGKSFLMAKIRQRVSQLTALAADDSGSEEIWSKVVPVEFNAWQYVETDLWAALLSRIFDELSPGARERLTELGRRQLEQRAKENANLAERLRAEWAIANLLVTEERQAAELRTAADKVTRAQRQADALSRAAARTALEAHARATATDMLVNELSKQVGSGVADSVEAAHRLKVAANVPAWKQGDFWSWRRAFWVLIAALLVPVVVIAVDLIGFSFPTAVTAALGACAAALVPVMRATTAFLDGQRKAAEEAEQKVADELSNLIRIAEEERTAKEKDVEATRTAIEDEREKARQAESQRVDVDVMAARLTPGTVYTDYLSARTTSDDYRKRLGIVSTVSDDLRTLSSLVTEYNGSDEAHSPGGPPNRIVLYIDDLDRCPPPRVVEMLEAVHLLLAFPLFVVVVAVDTRWLTAALTNALPLLKEEPVPNGGAPTPTDYLEKIFQIPFWVEALDDDGRHRMLRGLLLPSVAEPGGASIEQSGNALTASLLEQRAAAKMLAVHGPWLDRDAQRFTITTAELAFVEGLTPLVAGTPRQVKRLVNICKLLLAMSPPLAGGTTQATERTAACFMAAVHQSMPDFATELAAAAAAEPDSTLAAILADLTEPARRADRQQVQDWLSREPAPAPPDMPFGSAAAAILIKRWDVIRRLRFAEDWLHEPRPLVP
jgi:KAP family P-loop domain